MPWKEVSAMSLREEFVLLAKQEGANVAQLCRRFGVSRKTGYKWLKRFEADSLAALADRSRQPLHSPRRTPTDCEERILALRQQHPAWGGRKLRARLLALGVCAVPSASTITAILARHGLIEPSESSKHQPFVRFEHEQPNELWQMDFKGHFAVADGQRCHPLTVLDDHSRFAVGLVACCNEQTETVRSELTGLFRRYGLPWRMLMDNGSPWGDDWNHPYTPLTVWLLQIGVRVTHGRPFHPQTQGKDERFHRTLKAEVLRDSKFRRLADCQPRFDSWRAVYNLERPHEALGMQVPASRYQPSPRAFPETLSPIEYGPGDQVRKVQQGGWFSFRGRDVHVSSAFHSYSLALRATTTEDLWEVYFSDHRLGELDLRGIERGSLAAVPAYVHYKRAAHSGRHSGPCGEKTTN
jgi:transposase InsO family protein